MNISSTLYNDTSEGVIAFAEQLRQQLINWNEYPHVIGELGQDRPNLQNDLNALFLSVYEKFLTFLNDADSTSSAINTWKEIERFLADYADTGTLKEIVDQLNANIESRLNVVLENSTGSSTTNGMSQKAITDALGAKQDVIQDLSSIRSGVAKVGYYECSTQDSSAAKAISADNYVLSTGGSMKVKMINANTADNATLNINNTGAKPLYYAGKRASANNSWEAGETVEIYYDGTSYYANSVANSGDGAFDISAKTGQNYETLNDALTAANSAIPISKKKGGMSIKFIKPILATYLVEVRYDVTEIPSHSTSIDKSLIPAPGIYNSEDLENIPNLPSVLNTYKIYYAAVASSDNPAIRDMYNVMTVKKLTNESGEYLQYRLMSTAFNTTPSNWQGVDSQIQAKSKNLTESGAVEKAIRNTLPKEVIEDGLYICDSTGKAVVRLDILDTKGGFGDNLVAAINALITSGTASIVSDINDIESKAVKTSRTKEEGVYLCDEEGNALIRLDILDSKGGFGENLEKVILDYIKTTPPMKDVVDDGFYFCNNNGDVIAKYLDGKWIFYGNKEDGYYRRTGDLAANDVWVLSSNSVKNDKRLVFSGDITIFDSIIIGHGHGSDYAEYGLSAAQWNASRIVIDDTNIIVYNWNGSETSQAYPHGITSIENNIQVEIVKNHAATATVKLVSNGVSFSQDVTWLGSQGDIFLKSTSELTNCVFSWYCSKLRNGTWLFGDSYFSLTDSDRWTSYLFTDGFGDCIINGYSGGKCRVSLNYLQNLLTIATPDKVVWCLGMNNGDNESSVNSEWMSTYSDLKNICSGRNIELILATIPNASSSESTEGGSATTVLHDYKNTIVRESGYRYIDFAVAVGADSEGEWYDGMKNSTNVHPTTKGAKALYQRAICDVPELMK